MKKRKKRQKHGKMIARLRKDLADGARYQGGQYKDGKKHGPWIELHGGSVRTCEYRDGKRIGPLRKPKKKNWPALKPTIRARAPVPTTKWNDAKMHGPPLQGGRADGNR